MTPTQGLVRSIQRTMTLATTRVMEVEENGLYRSVLLRPLGVRYGRATGESRDSGGGSGQKAHARSRLSLLKNKIRMSENSQEGRSNRNSMKGSLERSKSDLHEHYLPSESSSGKYNFDYGSGSDTKSNAGRGSEVHREIYADHGNEYSHSYSKSDKHPHPGYGDEPEEWGARVRDRNVAQARGGTYGSAGAVVAVAVELDAQLVDAR